MRTHDGTGAFVIVDHDEEDAIQAGAPISNIYAAGANATLYTLSLRRNYRRGFVTDFSRVEGLPGASHPRCPVFAYPVRIPALQADCCHDFDVTHQARTSGQVLLNAHW